jgi:Flp pilus assembly protein TadG
MTSLSAARSTALRRSAHRRRFGSTQLEFALVLPFFLLFIVFALNMGLLIVSHGALQHAANAAARAGAQVGGASINNTSQVVFDETVRSMPGIDSRMVAMSATAGGVCSTGGSNRDVVIVARFDAPLAVPGMDQLIRMVGGQAMGPRITLNARAVARCEVVRS